MAPITREMVPHRAIVKWNDLLLVDPPRHLREAGRVIERHEDYALVIRLRDRRVVAVDYGSMTDVVLTPAATGRS